MKVSAWHSSHDYMVAVHTTHRDGIAPIELGKTHKKLPVSVIILNAEKDEVLDRAFDYFNWTQNEDMYAGKRINKFCAANGTHASMSVGDLVQINTEFWFCAPQGWTALPDNTLNLPK